VLWASESPIRGHVTVNTYLQVLVPLGLAATLSAIFCRLLRPLLMQYALARPNARSSHVEPTPQGGGIAVLLGAFGSVTLIIIASYASELVTGIFSIVAASCLVLAMVGAWDDIRPLPALLRLAAQIAVVLAVLIWAVPDIRLFPAALPLPIERLFVVLAAVWYINLTNFMDGLDWITVAAIVPAALMLGLMAQLGYLDPLTGLLAFALAGGLIGFAPFNRPVARLFLGDVGALPIGLLMAYLLYQLAGTGAFIAAILLPLYSISDASLTLTRRLLNRERVWEAHRSHFYQRATDNGLSAFAVSGHVLGLNTVLSCLALLAAWTSRPDLQLATLILGLVVTALVLRRFSSTRKSERRLLT
jgi:UDP-N-acetylmuramyl pentapeptide phosphotransferase/UDP-N-acetylglucosamine-1-phosphate transferase